MAKANQDKEMGNALRAIPNPSTIHINLEKHPISSEKLQLGKKITFKGHGKIQSVHQDKYGKSAIIEVSKMEHDDETDEGEDQ